MPHSPGTWKADGGHDYEDWPMSTILVMDDSGGSICEIHAHTSLETLAANAKLIAAAPRLLAALDCAELFVSGFEDDELQEGIADLLLDIRSALADAKSEYATQ